MNVVSSLAFRKACPWEGGGDQGKDGSAGQQPCHRSLRDGTETDGRRGCESAGVSVRRAPVFFTSVNSLQTTSYKSVKTNTDRGALRTYLQACWNSHPQIWVTRVPHCTLWWGHPCSPLCRNSSRNPFTNIPPCCVPSLTNS